MKFGIGKFHYNLVLNQKTKLHFESFRSDKIPHRKLVNITESLYRRQWREQNIFPFYFTGLYTETGDRCSTVVKVLCYKSDGRWFDSSWCHWNFSLTYNPSDRTMALGSNQKWVPGVFPGVKGGRCVRLKTLPPSCAVVMKSGNLNFLEPSGPLQACNGTALLFNTEI